MDGQNSGIYYIAKQKYSAQTPIHVFLILGEVYSSTYSIIQVNNRKKDVTS